MFDRSFQNAEHFSVGGVATVGVRENFGIQNQCGSMLISHNVIEGFGRDGINTDTTKAIANADQSIYRQNTIVYIRRHGMYFTGHDSAGILTQNNNVLFLADSATTRLPAPFTTSTSTMRSR